MKRPFELPKEWSNDGKEDAEWYGTIKVHHEEPHLQCINGETSWSKEKFRVYSDDDWNNATFVDSIEDAYKLADETNKRIYDAKYKPVTITEEVWDNMPIGAEFLAEGVYRPERFTYDENFINMYPLADRNTFGWKTFFPLNYIAYQFLSQFNLDGTK